MEGASLREKTGKLRIRGRQPVLVHNLGLVASRFLLVGGLRTKRQKAWNHHRIITKKIAFPRDRSPKGLKLFGQRGGKDVIEVGFSGVVQKGPERTYQKVRGDGGCVHKRLGACPASCSRGNWF